MNSSSRDDQQQAAGTGAVTSSLGDYYSASQLRTDRWCGLKGITARLAQAQRRRVATARIADEARRTLATLEPIEMYWAFPGPARFRHLHRLLDAEDYEALAGATARIARALMSGSYRRRAVLGDHLVLTEPERGDGGEGADDMAEGAEGRAPAKPYFEVLIVDQRLSPQQEHAVRAGLRSVRRNEDRFVYELVFVHSFEDALIAVLFNHNIQTVVVRYGFQFESKHRLDILHRYYGRVGEEGALRNIAPEDYGVELTRLINRVRPELDVFLVTDQLVEEVAGRDLGGCRRVFYNLEAHIELHLNILRGVAARYETPFFTALKEYSTQPTGVFHAMPISRGKSIYKSHWIQDMGEFYGPNIFLAETSATSGGLDSLLDPRGTIKKAQELAARAFGAKRTFFATNGTSTCNKIVVQALVRPGDIVLVDRDCHKSHHYGFVLGGAQVVYLDSYPMQRYSMYGAVPLREIKRQLLRLRAAGKLDRVRLLVLTNCTFDGIVYNVERVMEECLAIKPDLAFLWDEAWFGFARFGPIYRQRTAMHAAQALYERYHAPEYRARYEQRCEELKGAAGGDDDEKALLAAHLLPDPDRVRIRVYACQSTHKTLTALRQGSMIHVYDQDYKAQVEEPFHEAYMTHTSTSPNYQILASLDVGRRQVELEGFELVEKQVEMAMALRERIASHPLLSKYFELANVGDLIPPEYRRSGIESYHDPERGWNNLWKAWDEDEFVLDVSRVTLSTSGTGLDGDTFKTKMLMDRYGIQINKTSRNTVLFMTNIGTTRSSVAYLIEALVQIARELEERQADSSPVERAVFERRVRSLAEEVPPLPDFSRFHDAFRANDGTGTPEGDIRAAYFLAYDEDNCEYLGLDDGAINAAMAAGREVVSSSFVIPYPPGFPILVPGQVVSSEILRFMRALDVKEIHGYRPELGLHVFTEAALDRRPARERLAAE